MEARTCKRCGTVITPISTPSETGSVRQYWCPYCDPGHNNLIDIEETNLLSEVTMSKPDWIKLAEKEKEERGKVKSDVDVSFPEKEREEAAKEWKPSEGEKRIEREAEELRKRREK